MKRTRLLIVLLVCSFVLQEAFAQSLNVSGAVKDQTGKGIPGASVIIKGTTTGVSASADGNYSITVPRAGVVLVFSFIGMATQEVTVSKAGTINVSLEEQENVLGDVVIVGYGTQKRSNVTGSIATVNNKELVQTPVGDLSNALAGRTPGVITKQPSGEPGADGTQIYIRGNSTFGGGTMEPLFVIDGVVRSGRDFGQMDPNEIESVNVLKDASSAAIFGVKGANGVVLVTTKRGKAGQLSANYSFNYGFSKVTSLPDALGSYEYAVLYNEAKLNDNPNATPEFALDRLEAFKNGTNLDANPNTDWMGLILGGSAPRMQHNLSLSGGSEKVKYFTSFGYLNEDGLYSSLNYNRYNVRSNIDIQATSTTKISIDLSGRIESKLSPPASIDNIFEHTLRNPPVFPAKFSNGLLASPGVYPNPLALVSEESGYSKNSSTYFLSNFQVVQQIPGVQGLSVKGVLAFDKNFNSGKTWNQWVPLYTRNNDDTYTITAQSKSSLSKSYGDGQGVELQGHINYDRQFGKHGISALALVLQKENQGTGIYGARNSYESSALQILNFGPALNEVLSDGENKTALRSAAVRFNYDYDGKYLFQASLRRDESENFAPKERVGYFPAVSAGWLISKENFMANVKAVDFLKIKASYGELGSDRIPSRFGYYNRYNLVPNAYPFGGVPNTGLTPGAIANENLTWETSVKMDVGVEAKFFNNLLGLDVTYFKERRKDILATRSLSVPLSFGAALPSENFGIVDNQGVEVVLSHNNKVSNNWSYFVNGNFTYAKNKIVEAAEASNVPAGKKITGRSNGGYYGYKAIGIFKDAADYAASAKPTAFLNSTGPGDIKYQDISGPNGTPDGIIDDNDVTYLGNGSLPRILYGIHGGVSFKSIEFNFLFQGAAQSQQMITQTAAWAFHNGGRVNAEWLDRWRPERPNATMPRLTLNTNGNNYIGSNFWLQNSSYLRLKNVEFAYTIKHKALSKIGANNLRVYAQGQNLFTITDLLNLDPENTSAIGRYYPQQRTYTFGLNVQF
jgi:TonB-linked SusC/RagA family outer membrane protein